MAEDILANNLREIGYLMSALIIPLAAAILGKKLLNERKVRGELNYVRLIIFAVFAVFGVLSIFEYLVHVDIYPLLNDFFGGGIESITLYSILIGTMVSLGLTLVFYANRWESLYYSSLFFFAGMVIFYYITGFDAWVETYIQIAAVVSLVFIYLTSYRVKDNGALGVAIFFTLAFSTLIIEISLVNQILIIVYNVFILTFSLGFFKVFKEKVTS